MRDVSHSFRDFRAYQRMPSWNADTKTKTLCGSTADVSVNMVALNANLPEKTRVFCSLYIHSSINFELTITMTLPPSPPRSLATGVFLKESFTEGNFRDKCCCFLPSLAKLGVMGTIPGPWLCQEMREEFAQYWGRLLLDKARSELLHEEDEVPSRGSLLGARGYKRGFWTMKDSGCRKHLTKHRLRVVFSLCVLV